MILNAVTLLYLHKRNITYLLHSWLLGHWNIYFKNIFVDNSRFFSITHIQYLFSHDMEGIEWQDSFVFPPILPQNPDAAVSKQFNPILHICYLYTVLTCVKQSS